jgi:hypothetical protein
MQNPTTMDKVVIKNYYHMTTIDENVYWMKLTYLLSIFCSNLQGLLLYIYLYFTILNNFLKMYTLEKNDASPLCILFTLTPHKLPLPTLTLIYTWYEKSIPMVKGWCDLLGFP